MVMKMRKMMQRGNGQKGFTLIELIVVMAILAVLAAIAIPKYTGILAQSKRNANDSNIDMIAHAAELYYGANTPNVVPTAIATLTDSDYLKSVPVNPVTNSAYSLTASGTGVQITPGKYGTSTSAAANYTYSF